MKVSLNTIRGLNRRYKTADDVVAMGVDGLVDKIGSQLGAVEEILQIGEKYEGIIVAKVVSCEDHPDADRLHVCTIDDGGKAKDIGRDDKGYVQVVCGAPNVREGLLVAWLPPGSIVPDSVGKEPFKLEAREIRGVVSNGMLASPKELALGDGHDGILEIIDPFNKVHPGDDFAEVFELKDDVVLDIENKMFTHRPDCFGFLGVSRELAGIQGMAFKSPDWYAPNTKFPGKEADELPLVVRNELPELVPRFTAVTMRDVQVGPSPTWLVIELAKVGLRSINNIVDYTNFFMLETGQPLHAYDYDKVKALSGDVATLVIRNPHESERITLLNGKTINPRQEAIMIATDRQLIGVGGVMGGSETEVDETTKHIIIECGNFDMYSIRRTSMAHGLFTDAVTRFNKGQSPLQNLAVIGKIVDEIRKYADGKVASDVIDVNQVAGREWVHPPVPVSTTFINDRLGFDLSSDDMKTLLENVEFKVEVSNDRMEDDKVLEPFLTVTAPFWRTDVETREDVVEEIGRLYGFDKLPLELPQRSIRPVEKDQMLELKRRIREHLVKAGANEVLTYTFVHGDLMDKVGQNKDEAFQLHNALSPELQYYRLSLTPSLLEKVHPNIKAGYGRFALFEMGKAHTITEVDKDGLPLEFDVLALVVAAEDKTAAQYYGGAAYYEARAYMMDLLGKLDSPEKLTFVPLNKVQLSDLVHFGQMLQPYDPDRAAVLLHNDDPVGVVGEYRASVRRALKLPKFCAGFGILLSYLPVVAQNKYVPLSRFPKIEQDITLKVSTDVTYQRLFEVVTESLGELVPEQTSHMLQPLDIYQKSDDKEHKQVTFRLTITSYEKTMRDKEVTAMLDGVAASASKTLGAERI